MAATRYQSSDLRRQLGSPRPKGRGSSARNLSSSWRDTPSAVANVANAKENKDTLCRNIMIYGNCRYEDQGCAFNHDQGKGKSTQSSESSKKSLSVESPSFTPAANIPTGPRKATFSTSAAAAPAFTPRGLEASSPIFAAETGESSAMGAAMGAASSSSSTTTTFNPAKIREFTPTASFDLNASLSGTGSSSDEPPPVQYNPYSLTSLGQALATPYNPYADEHAALGASAYFGAASGYGAPLQPLQHHLYAPVGPHREDLQPYQRHTADFFLPENVRLDLQKRSEAALQVLPNSQLPQLDNFHSLVPLDTTTHRKSASLFGHTSWVYKATSIKTGKLYCLRRLEGYRLTNEHAIRQVKEWRKVRNGGVASIHDAFTTRAFGDSSLVFVQDYHPLSKTLVEAHLAPAPTTGGRFHQPQQPPPKTPIAEDVLWGYVAQIGNALKAIHDLKLAARCVDASKIIVSNKNRVRLSACSVLDVVHFENKRPLADIQQDDLLQFGRVMLCLATNTPPAQLTDTKGPIEQMGRTYSLEMKDTIMWLLTPATPPAVKEIDEFIRGVSTHIIFAFDASLQESDLLGAELFRELENGRIARLMMKLATVNERSDFDGDRTWSENGERYILKLFRDYVFHQVDANGNPVLDPGHMIRCLNKLDAGIDERILLTSRDEQTTFLVTYKEVKKQLNSAFNELQKGLKATRGP